MTIVMTMVRYMSGPLTSSAMGTDVGRSSGPRAIKASEFKAKCLQLMDEVAANGEDIVITKNGRPTARLVAYREKPKTLFGIDRGKLEIHGDIIPPLDVEWETESVQAG